MGKAGLSYPAIAMLVSATALQASVPTAAQTARGEVQHEVKSYSESQIRRLASSMCLEMSLAAEDKPPNFGLKLEDMILEFNGWTRDTPNYRKKWVSFFNKYTDQMICRVDSVRFYNQHIFARAVALQTYESVLLNFFFVDENLLPVDPNAVWRPTIDGKPGTEETVLDVINRVISVTENELKRGFVYPSYNLEELYELRDILVEYYGAKTAAEIRASQAGE